MHFRFLLKFHFLVWIFLIGFSYLALSQGKAIPFEEFFGVNSVRESDSSWLNDQYAVSKYHRIFGMDSYVFGGEEIVESFSKNIFKVNPEVPHDAYPDDRYGFNPARGGKGFDFDYFLRKLKQNGIRAIPVLAKNLLYTSIEEDNTVHVWTKPNDKGGDPSDPMSYRAFSSFLFQFTARYGSKEVPGELLKLSQGNQLLSGLDLVYAIEPGNEMNKDWFTEKQNMSPMEMAAFLSASIDGHMGKMGPGHGIRQADADMKIVFPSPHDIDSEYLLEVRRLIIEMRREAKDLGYPQDPMVNMVMTAHYYPVKGASQRYAKGGQDFDQSDMLAKSLEFTSLIRENFTEAEIWLTETGYDKMTDPKRSRVASPINSQDPVRNGMPNERAQARNLAKLVLGMSGSGFDRIFTFTLKDPQFRNHRAYGSTFLSSGLCYKDGEKALSWFALSNIRASLKGYHYKESYVRNNIRFTVYQKAEQKIIALWSTDAEKKQISLNFEKDGMIRIMDLGSSNGGLTDKKISNRNAEIAVTDFPKLVFISNQRIVQIDH